MPELARTMIVTGASSGIGRALALAAARAGYRVVAGARRAQLLDDVAREIRDGGGDCVTLAGDITAPDMPARIVGAALQAFGRIDAVVNNAGVGAYGSLLDAGDAGLDAQWKLHVVAPLRLARAAVGHLEKTHGVLVFVGSGIARVPLPNYGGYAVAKAAIRAAAIQLRRELRSRRVAVTYVDPGVVATEFHSRLGIERTTKFAVPAERVARAILRGIARRSAVVSAVPWQTASGALGEWFGTLSDPLVIKHFSARRARGNEQAPPPPARHPEPFELTLEPVARRMERVKLSPDFLREALAPGTTLELNALAMRWAGMPNKNERAALREVLDFLESAGYLQRVEGETWRVIRAAD